MGLTICNCYEFTAPCNSTVDYVDCNGNEQTESIWGGNLYRICSLTEPVTGCLTGVIANIGECIDGECPYPNCEESIEVNFKFDNEGFIENLTFLVQINGNLNGKPYYEQIEGEDNYVIVFWDNITNCWKTQIGICCYILVDTEYENCQDTEYPPKNGWTLVLGTEIIDLTVGCFQPTTTTTTIIPTTTTTTTFNPVPNTPLEPTNECDVITIFPMSVECFTINPTNTETFNGVASLVITGGTPPYEILWETGSVGTTITNLGVGEYTATVTDSYGDFIIITTCELTAPPAPTTTTTTSTTTLPQFGDLCMIITAKNDAEFDNIFIDFTFNGYYNEKPSWLAITENLFMYWNTGTTSQWLISGTTSNTLYNQNPATPPTSGWEFLGPIKLSVSVVEGNCDNISPLSFTLSKNDSNCENNGSIIVTASGGVPPYLYSLNNGITTQTSPIFQNLGQGTYIVSVIDSVNVIETQNITINQIGTNTTYVVTLNTTSNNFNITVNPTLPAGVTITYDIVYQNEFKVAPTSGAATQVITPTINVNGSPISNPSPVVTNSTQFNPCNGGNFSITNRVFTWANVTMTTTTTVNGTILTTINAITPLPSCYFANFTKSITLNNLKISGCECCSTLLQQNQIPSEIFGAL